MGAVDEVIAAKRQEPAREFSAEVVADLTKILSHNDSCRHKQQFSLVETIRTLEQEHGVLTSRWELERFVKAKFGRRGWGQK